jgi:hypothetical protein
MSKLEGLTLRSGPKGRVSKGCQQHDWFPPFETRACGVLLRVRFPNTRGS